MKYPAIQRCAALAAVIVIAPASWAQEEPRDQRRFTFTPTEGGFMRLDTKAGGISICARAGAGFACRSVQDDRAALDDEIGRLAKDNDALKARVAELENRAFASKIEAPARAPASAYGWPGSADFDAAFETLEQLMRKWSAALRGPLSKPDRT